MTQVLKKAENEDVDAVEVVDVDDDAGKIGIDKIFRDFLDQNEPRILNTLRKTTDVLDLVMTEFSILTSDEYETIKCATSRSSQKEMLLDFLVDKGYKHILEIIEILNRTNNEHLGTIFQLLHQELKSIYPTTYDPNQVKSDDSSKYKFSGTDEAGIDEEDDPWIVVVDLIPKRKDCCKSFFILRNAASNGDFSTFVKKIKGKNPLLSPCEKCLRKTDGQTLVHAAAQAKNSSEGIKCIYAFIKTTLERRGVSISTTDGKYKRIFKRQARFLCDQQDYLGQAPIHLAIKKKRVKMVEHLYFEFKCNILIKNNEGDSALDLINFHLPNICRCVLNKESLPGANADDFEDSVEIDFAFIIGYHPPIQDGTTIAMTNPARSDRFLRNYSEMQSLAKLVYSQQKASHNLLSHVIVKSFLDLKWNKLERFMLPLILIKMLIYISHILFVVHVFLGDCPIPSRATSPTTEDSSHANLSEDIAETEIKNIGTYFSGSLNQLMMDLFYASPSSTPVPSCDLQFHLLPLTSLAFGIILLITEIMEIILLREIKLEGKRCGLSTYLTSWENLFQILLDLIMITIGTLAFRKSVPNIYYVLAVVSIFLASALLFMEMGLLFGQGMYVQLLGKIMRRFFSLMFVYWIWIAAFSIALSILFPNVKSFETFPKSFSRVITMMSGELDHVETLYSSDNETGIGTEFTAHMIYASLTLLLTIVMSNALIGLVVSDVRELQERSEIINRSVQVNALFTAEAFLLTLRNLLYFMKTFIQILDLWIFVISPADFMSVDQNGHHKPTGNGMVIRTSLKKLNVSEKRKQEILEFAMDAKINIRRCSHSPGDILTDFE